MTFLDIMLYLRHIVVPALRDVVLQFTSFLKGKVYLRPKTITN